VVTTLDAEFAGGTHFLVMERVDGESLARVVHSRGLLPVAEACEYARQRHSACTTRTPTVSSTET